MTEYLLYVWFLAIPVGTFGLMKRVWLSYLTSCLLGCPVLIARMIYLESKAPDSDFDIIFLFSIAVWCVALCAIYAGIALSVSFARRRKGKIQPTF